MRTVKGALVVLVVLALSGCSRPGAPPDVAAALEAGEALLSGMDKCIAHIEQAGDANTPECDQSSAKSAYDEARSKVVTPVPAISVIDEKMLAAMGKIMSLGFEAEKKRRAAKAP